MEILRLSELVDLESSSKDNFTLDGGSEPLADIK